MLAVLALESGIPPQDLLDAPDEVLNEMVSVLEERADEQNRQSLRQDLAARVR